MNIQDLKKLISYAIELMEKKYKHHVNILDDKIINTKDFHTIKYLMPYKNIMYQNYENNQSILWNFKFNTPDDELIEKQDRIIGDIANMLLNTKTPDFINDV